MKTSSYKVICSFLCALALCLFASQVISADPMPQGLAYPNTATLGSLQSMPLAFTQNNGQWPDSILYRASAGGATMWFTNGGAYYQLTRRTGSSGFALPGVGNEDVKTDPGRVETMLIRAGFVGGNPSPRTSGVDRLEYKCNYFLGSDRSRWQPDVPNYQAMVYEDIYPGISLKYYGNGHQMEYDFQISPGADYSQIKVKYDGAKSLTVNASGELVIETEFGSITERRPVVYQIDGGSKVELAGDYVIGESNSFSFKVDKAYNPALPLVIDPVLVYSTYLGGSGGTMNEDDRGYDIAVDASGNAYVTGITCSADFPASSGYDNSYNGSNDAYVSKLSPTGNSLIYSTFLGGSSEDFARGVTLDNDGNVYIVGVTGSTNFPMQNAYDNTLGGNIDAFVAKLSADGNSLLYSTYLGGSGDEYDRIDNFQEIGAIAVDAAGSAYVTGVTNSADFPTVSAFQSVAGGLWDAFVTKLNSSGNGLVYSSYLGGSGTDYAMGIALNGAGEAYVSGTTGSLNFPCVNGYAQIRSGVRDAFLAKVSSDGSTQLYGTYFGGSLGDYATHMTIDALGYAYFTGITYSADFPRVNAFDYVLDGQTDAFVVKLKPETNTIGYSTFLGGSVGGSGGGAGMGVEQGGGIKVDASGCAYVCGLTNSTDFPCIRSFDNSYNGGAWDAFVTKLAPAGDALLYSSYLGGSDIDWAPSMAIDAAGNAYVVGSTFSSDFPTLNAFDNSLGGLNDGFVTKISAYNDADLDGLTDEEELALGTNPNNRDSDGDGVDDFTEVTAEGGSVGNPADTDGDAIINALDPDDDNDGVPTSVELARGDTDSDAIPDYLDNDDDGDGVLTMVDNCPLIPNGDQTDTNKDGIGDACCCIASTGNVDCDPADAVDISDLSALIDNLYISLSPLCCPKEANVDGQPGTDISDLSALIDYLYINFTPPSACQ